MPGLDVDDHLLRVGLALQKYRLHSPGTDIPVPRYVIMGLQSAGKTRLLSMLARTKIGGAEKANCGTRCPVEYSFEPSEAGSEPMFGFGTSASNLRVGSASDVAAFVTSHMDGLAEEERRNQQGFDEHPIFVQVKAPNATPLVVADCPGLQSPEAKANNACITAIYKSQLEAPNTTAIIVSALPSTLDIQQITKELGDFVRGANLPSEVYRGAVLLVNRLDAVKTSLDKSDAPLREFQKQAEERYGFALPRMGFVCLVPEVLGEQHSTPLLKSDSRVEEQNRYFAEMAWEVEQEALHHFAKVHLGLEQPPDNVGVRACIGLVHRDLKRKIMAGWDRTLEGLLSEWTDEIEPQLNRVLLDTEIDDGELKAELDQYLGINCEGFAGFQADDLARRLETSVGKVNQEWVVKVSAASCKHEVSAGKTYLTECEEETGLQRNAALDKVLLHKKTRKRLEKAKDHPVAEMTNELYYGEAAIRRLVTMQRLAWMREPIREFTLAEIRNMGAFIDGEDERGLNLRAIVRKAVGRVQASSAEDITRFMRMVKRCLVSLCDHVRGILQESVPMLREAPKFRDFIDEECVTRHYVQLIGKCCDEAEAKMQDLIKARFSSLSFDEPLNLVRILMCSGFDLTMLDPPSHFRDRTQNGGRDPMDEERVKQIMGKFVGLLLPAGVQELAETFVSTLLRSPGNTETDEDFFKAIVSAANKLSSEGGEDPALTLALNDRLNVTSIPLLEYKAQQGKINDTIHAFVRFCRGMALMDVQMVLEKDVILEARQLRNTMTLRMKEISDHLFSHESQELLECLKAQSGTPLAESQALRARVAAYESMLIQICEAPDVPVQLQSVRQRLPSCLLQLEQYVVSEERKAGAGGAGSPWGGEAELKRQFFERLAVLGEKRLRKQVASGNAARNARPLSPNSTELEDIKEQARRVKQHLTSELRVEKDRGRELERRLTAAEARIRRSERRSSTSSGRSVSSTGSAQSLSAAGGGVRVAGTRRISAGGTGGSMREGQPTAKIAKLTEERDGALAKQQELQRELDKQSGSACAQQQELQNMLDDAMTMQCKQQQELAKLTEERDGALAKQQELQRELDKQSGSARAQQQELQKKFDAAMTMQRKQQQKLDDALAKEKQLQQERDNALAQEKRPQARLNEFDGTSSPYGFPWASMWQGAKEALRDEAR